MKKSILKHLSIDSSRREVDVSEITTEVRDLSIEANIVANCDLRDTLTVSLKEEISPMSVNSRGGTYND